MTIYTPWAVWRYHATWSHTHAGMSPSRPILLSVYLTAVGLSQAGAAVYKCVAGDQITYQSTPCLAGQVSAAIGPPATSPDAATLAQAQARAQADLQAAEALRRQEARQAMEEQMRRLKEARHAQYCARLLAAIRAVESTPEGKGRPVRARGERREYLRKCGPL